MPMRLEMRRFGAGEAATVLRRSRDGTPERETFRAGPGGAIWFRWFPDGNFAERGIALPSDTDRAALATFEALEHRGDFPRMSRPETRNAWDAFCADVGGAARATWLWRNRAVLDRDRDDPDLRNGRICGLPRRVAVFALIGRDVKHLATGGVIDRGGPDKPNALSYAPGLIDSRSWLTDFDIAIAAGMGLRLDAPDPVALASSADWLIAVGLSGEDGRAEIEAFLEDATANDALAFLRSHDATNNAGEVTTGFSASATAPLKDGPDRFAFEEGVFEKPGLAATDLAEALGISEQRLSQVPDAAIDHRGAASAMITLIGPVLLDDKLDGTSQLRDMPETAFIAAVAEHFIPRGYHAPMRFGDNAYGIVPLAPMAGFAAKDIPDADQAQVAATTQVFGALLGGVMAAESEITTPRIHPEDPDAAEKLEAILQSYATGRRIEIYQTEDGEEDDTPLMLDCAYVAGPDAGDHPSAYLSRLLEEDIDDLDDPDASDRKTPLLYRLIRRSLTRNFRFQMVRAEGDVDFVLDRLSKLDAVVTTLPGGVRTAIDWTQARSLSGIAGTDPGQRFPGLTPQTRAFLNPLADRFTAALRTLKVLADREDGVAQLEALMLEVVDLFQFRLDAWITGISQMKLAGLRADAEKDPDVAPAPLRLGYYGLLALRRDNAEAEENRAKTKCGQIGHFLQAPTPAQATAAAVLHSARMRHGDSGAFDIDLSAPRVRLGLDLLDRLRVGMPLGAALGLLGERSLRDREASMRILPLRHNFPFVNAASADRAGQGRRPAIANVFDGLAFVSAPRPAAPASDRALHDRLSEALDALSDLVMAEAVYQRARGASERAAAWLDVLSGGPVPERPEFIGSQRPAHASEHRVMLALTPAPTRATAAETGDPTLGDMDAATPTPAGLLAEADPDLASLARKALSRRGEDGVAVRIETLSENRPATEVVLSFKETFYLPEIELLFSSEEALERRAIAAALNVMANTRDPETRAQFAAFDADGLRSSGAHRVTLHHHPSGTPLAEWHRRAREVAGMLRRARRLEPSDWQPIGRHDIPVTEADFLPAWRSALAALRGRRTALETRLRENLKRLDRQRGQFFDDFDAGLFGDGAHDPASPGGPPELWRQCARFNERLTRVAVLMPGAKLPFLTPDRLATDRLEMEEAVTRLIETLAQRQSAARKTGQGPDDDTEGALRAALDAEIAALQMLLGRDKFPVSVRFPHVEATRPAYEEPRHLDEGLAPWVSMRKSLAPLLTLGEMMPELELRPGIDHAATPTATAARDDLRDEAQAPRKHHFARIIGAPRSFTQQVNFAGYTIDEWTEKRPSRVQNATLALHYDAPQAEAANALLLGVPPSRDAPDWTADSVAHLVRDLVTWTRIRAMTTQDTMLETSILPGSNVVEGKGQGAASVFRIPTREARLNVGPPSRIAGRFERSAAGEGVGMAASGLHEAGLFSGKRGGK
ncbi:hypothetical protein SAMN05421759_1102 [Roseivivax lentus]|uniref:Uncharacterized protein n=1 Tax=Roseivivax lentus TaxID=633194 RepID=A0A1N7NRX8_9RHOB|nr:hypothetical protein [Roseivivax lentus]SIT01050.1 hypothetical protein SAMN05421759_1102 [Roseivivax lentus]